MIQFESHSFTSQIYDIIFYSLMVTYLLSHTKKKKLYTFWVALGQIHGQIHSQTE